jgi:tetratricopeptide (TPR) repeat protein
MNPSAEWTVASPAERPETPRQSPRLRRDRILLFCLTLVAAVLVCYRPAIHNGFLNYDDDAYITNNDHVKAGLTRATVKWALTTFDAANYHPLTWLAHALNCQLFGLNPAAHHESSVLLHGACAMLLFLWLLRATGLLWRSLFVAALFALHPINVESVAWAAELKNVLSMLFFLLALHAYVWYVQRLRASRYALVVVLFALALLSKPQVITFPILLLLLDYWPLQRIGRERAQGTEGTAISQERNESVRWLLLEKIPFVLLSVASAVVTMKAQRAGGAVQPFTQYSFLLRCETAVVAYVCYLGKAFWPAKLVALYPHPRALYPAWQPVAALLLLIVVTIVVLRARHRRYLAAGWLWFLCAIVPMLGLVQVGSQAMADRYAYIPFIGLFFGLTWLVADWAKATRFRAGVLAAAAAVSLLALGAATYHQAGYWHDRENFWRRTIALTENNYVAQDSLGEYLAEQGRNDEAAAHFRAALAIRHDDLPANLNLGTYEHSRGNFPAAIAHYQIVAQYAGDRGLRALAFGNLGSVYRQLGDLARAKQCFENSLALQPDHPLPMALIGLGLIAQKSGNFDDAIRDYMKAMTIQPTDVGFLLVAQALEEEGKGDEAKAIRERVQKLSPEPEAASKQAESMLGK